jgi:TPR repeat protein
MRPLAASILHPLAEAGDVDAQYWLGTVAEEGRRSPSDREEAIRWYRMAALAGDAEAAYQLAHLFDNHLDSAGRALGDAAEKVRWLRRAAEVGHPEAALGLGTAYSDSEGVARDTAEEQRWYKRAHHIKAGWSRLSQPACVEDASAPELLPAFLACNRGDADGLAGALLPLARAGHARAQAWVGYIMVGGPGTGGGYDLRVRSNIQRAARWYAKAAEQGLASAMYDYGVILEHGMGVPVDAAGARAWYEKAATQGYAPAREALAMLR